MGDMKRSARGVDDEDRGAEIDPFAELADIFDSELGQSAFRSTADRHFADSPPMDADFEADFADALEADMAPVRKSHAFVSMPVIAPVAVQSYQNWVAPRGARASIPVDPAARSASSGGQSYIETAFRELSAPANPRDMIVVEAQSFAPERMLDDGLREPAAPELDDFDELIASELAAMNVPRRAAPLAAANSLHDNRQHHGENSAYASAEDNDADEDEDYAVHAAAGTARSSRGAWLCWAGA
ncbi:MAG: hypothetical protein H7Y08_12015 [Rhizobiaceae bacterium]|nr:hypothetical protein [Rhizobiaceae bacterium]